MINAKLTRCRECRAPVWSGVDGTICALHVLADIVPISALGEALALVQGRGTYRLVRNGAGMRLQVRDRWDIASRPPGDTTQRSRYDVLAQHRCTAAALPTTASMYVDAGKGALIGQADSSDDDPPF